MLCDSARPFLLVTVHISGWVRVGWKKSCFSLSLPSLGNCVFILFLFLSFSIVNHVLVSHFVSGSLLHRLSFDLIVGCPTWWSWLYILPFDSLISSRLLFFFTMTCVFSPGLYRISLFSIASSRVLRCRAIRSRILSLFDIWFIFLSTCSSSLFSHLPCILPWQGWSSYRYMLDSSD